MSNFFLYNFQFIWFMLLTFHVSIVCVVHISHWTYFQVWSSRVISNNVISTCSLLLPNNWVLSNPGISSFSTVLCSFWTLSLLCLQRKVKEKIKKRSKRKKMQQWFTIAFCCSLCGSSHVCLSSCYCNNKSQIGSTLLEVNIYMWT